MAQAIEKLNKEDAILLQGITFEIACRRGCVFNEEW